MEDTKMRRRRRQRCTQNLFLVSYCLAAAAVAVTANANLPPPPPKIPPFTSQQQQRQQTQQILQQQNSDDGILPPPPPPRDDTEPFSSNHDPSKDRSQQPSRQSHLGVDLEASRRKIGPQPATDTLDIRPPSDDRTVLAAEPSSSSSSSLSSFSSTTSKSATTTGGNHNSYNSHQDNHQPPLQQEGMPRRSVEQRQLQQQPNIQTLPPQQLAGSSYTNTVRQQQQQQLPLQNMMGTPSSTKLPPLMQQQYGVPPPQQQLAGAASASSYRRLPPPGYRSSIPKPAAAAAATGLQALWKRVEQSLDSLADLEENFSSGAQRIASSALQSTLTTWKRPQQQQQQQEGRAQDSKMGVGVRQPASTSARDHRDPAAVIAVATKSIKTKAEQKPHALAKPAIEGSHPGATIRSARWNNIMSDKKGQKEALQSNGGASHSPHDKFSGTASSSLPPPRPGIDPNIRGSPRAADMQQRWPPPPSDQQPPWSRAATFEQETPATTAAASTDVQRRKSPFPGDYPPGSRTANVPQGAATSVPPPRQNSFYDDEDDRPSLLSRVGTLLPPVPRLPSIFKLFRRQTSLRDYAALDVWKDDDDESRKGRGIFGIFRRGSVKKTSNGSARRSSPKASLQSTPLLNDLMERCDNGKTASLLSKAEIRACRSIGNSRATLDVVCLVFLLLAMHQMPNVAGIPLPFPLDEMFSQSLTGFGTAVLFTMQTWAPFAFASAFLTARTNDILNGARTKHLAQSTAVAAKESGTYGQLYLRLAASQPPDTSIPERLYQAAQAQVVGRVMAARLRSFVSFVLTALVFMTVSVARPIALELIKSLVGVATLAEWRSWPLPWKDIGANVFLASHSLYQRISNLITSDLSGLLENPYQFAFHVSLFVALSAVYFLPSLEHRRPIPASVTKPASEEDGSAAGFGSVESLSNMGISSASRLQLWASGSGIEGILEKWRTMLPSSPRVRNEWITRSLLRRVGYGVLIALMLSLPVLVRTAVGISEKPVSSHSIFQWESALDVAILLLFTFNLSWRAMHHVVQSTYSRPLVHEFLKELSATMEEISSLRKSYMDLQLVAAISPTKGLAVNDLWAAHATKRAWAVRGASLECRNGELLVIIGDDGAGKTRLVTTIAESMVIPPKEALSTTKVRGLISLGGVDVTKWDRAQLRRRLGLVLNDVRTIADSAELLSGLTLEEILEPSDGLLLADPSHTAGVNERNSMILALKMTGLAASLLPRLPTKLSTVVSANEEDLKPSPLRPRCQVLSPSEWSKLLLTRVLAQCIFDNDNSAKSTDKIDNCLVGSLLLLDDATVHMSEVDEAAFLAALRRTSAACVITSNKWATGRFADRIVVMKDGVVVEVGTHTELLNRGPQQSFYASKWLAMTTN